MAVPVGAILGIASLAASLIGAGVQHASNAKTREFNSAEAVKQREFEEEMSSTAYQRAVQDIKEAGLNPSMLYVSGGPGASTPNSASASTNQINMNVIGQIGTLIDSINNARALDMKYKQKNLTTTKMFNDAGQLVSALVREQENY